MSFNVEPRVYIVSIVPQPTYPIAGDEVVLQYYVISSLTTSGGEKVCVTAPANLIRTDRPVTVEWVSGGATQVVACPTT